jgi:signal transduction histidine kinase
MGALKLAAFAAYETRRPSADHGVSPAHSVQLYDKEDFLCDVVSNFLADGLTAGQPIVVMATRAHGDAFATRLERQGFDVSQLARKGQLVVADAREALAAFMTGRMPDARLFESHVGGLIENSLRGSRGISARAYGEMVDLLWQDGNPDAAIRVEELWNALARRHAFMLLCAYAMTNFHSEAHAQQFQAVCNQHTHVLPAESYRADEDEETKAREISRLQQRSRALESEIESRKELEHALCDALSERRRAHDALQAALAEAEHANRLKDEFLALLSHELRTPLNAIVGWSRLVCSPNATDATIRHGLDVVQRNAALQLHLINDLLDISRIVTGKMRMRMEHVDLNAILSSEAERTRPVATSKGVDLQLRASAPAPHTPCTVVGDADRLHQVVWNLVSNAIKFTPSQGRIELRLERAGSMANIIVSDSGQGIARQFLPHVFERFRQADTSTTRQHGGLGLGLAVVRHIVESHGGTVSVDSPGHDLGATFTVSLPVCAPDHEEAPEMSEPASAAVPSSRW